MTPCLLVVDDEPDILLTVTDLLSDVLPGWRLVQARSGEEALAAHDQALPTVVLSDYLMPGMNGLELSRRLRARGAPAPFLLMTAFVDSGMEQEMTQTGLIHRFFKKPLDPDRLVQAIRQYA